MRLSSFVRLGFVIVAGIFLVGCGSDHAPQASRPAAKSTTTANPSATSSPAEASAPLPASNVAPPAPAHDGPVRFGALLITAPKTWIRKPAASSFVEAEFALPKAKAVPDDQDGRLTLSVAGGSIAANIERWQGQFTGDSALKKETKKLPSGLEATLVELTGDFNDQRGPFTPAASRSHARMIAVIIPVGAQLHFIKAVGSMKTMEQYTASIQESLNSIKPEN